VIVQFKYGGQSRIVSGLSSGRVALATNTLREATYFHGQLGRPLLLREGLAALYDVVVSDFKYRPRDREAFSAWLAEQDRKFLLGLALDSSEARQQLEQLELRRAELDGLRQKRRAGFFEARRRYFDFAYTNEYELSLVLDPVITIHPDEIAFEAFSRDESSYARLAAKYDLFERIDAFECGTTNVDFSARLYSELDRMRSYRATRFDVDPSGFGVASAGVSAHKEKKVDLPDSWLNGFLQVHAAMTLGLARVRLSPIDLYNLCRFVRRRRAKASPRAMRWLLVPGRRTRVVFEPWEHVIELSPSSVFEGDKELTIRTWGRDRLRTLARVLPVVERAEVYLAGHGLPSIYVCDLGDATFTLALSGWTDNDWTGDARFGLLSRRLDATADELTRSYEALRKVRFATAAALAAETGLGVEKTRSSLSFLCQAGRAMFDLGGGVFRHRDLFLEPFSAKNTLNEVAAKAEASDPRALAARQIFEAGDVRMIARRPVTAGYKLSGSAKGADGERVRPLLSVDHQGAILEATCTCRHFRTHRLTLGPCEHVLALRLAHMSRLQAEDRKGG
jgi:hypothetical protein